MLRSSELVITSNGTSQAVPLDRYVNGYAVSVTLSTSAMTATYTLQQSLLDPFCSQMQGNAYTTSYKVSGQWVNSSDPVMVNASGSNVSNFTFPPRAVRMITSNVSGGSLTLSLVPMGMDGN